MKPRIRLLRRSCGLMLVVLLLTAGCQIPLRKHAGANTSCAAIPPLSNGPLSMNLGWNSPAPARVPEPSLPPLPPPLSDSPIVPAGGSSQTFVPPVSTATAAASIPAPANVVAAAGESCLPDQKQWRQEMEEQTSGLQRQFSQLEANLHQTQEQLQRVTHDLHASQEEIRQLNSAVSYWQAEVKRLERESRAQQEADLKSLDELSAALSQLLGKQRPRNMGASK